MEKPLSQQVSDGMRHFRRHPDKIGTKQWNVFKRMVLKPHSDELLATFDSEDQAFLRSLLKKLGGFIVKAGGN